MSDTEHVLFGMIFLFKYKLR